MQEGRGLQEQKEHKNIWRARVLKDTFATKPGPPPQCSLPALWGVQVNKLLLSGNHQSPAPPMPWVRRHWDTPVIPLG